MMNSVLTTQRILVTLGAPNSITGVLSDIAMQRMQACLDVYIPGDKIICTGGWGTHFNQADQPHAYYARQFLQVNGIPEEAFLELALSSNTVDDAVKLKAIVEQEESSELVIISSDFHMERVQLIFDEILKGYMLSYVAAKTELPVLELEALKTHEKRAIAKINEDGLYY